MGNLNSASQNMFPFLAKKLFPFLVLKIIQNLQLMLFIFILLAIYSHRFFYTNRRNNGSFHTHINEYFLTRDLRRAHLLRKKRNERACFIREYKRRGFTNKQTIKTRISIVATQ